MDLRQLRYVVAVARLAGFTRAAEELHVAQPALSLAVRTLESELGIRLFDRTSRRVTPTDAGVAFAARAARIIDEVDGLGEEMAEFAGALRGQVRASIWYHLDPDLPAMLREFITQNPRIQFSIVELPSPAAAGALRAGTIDFGVMALAPGLDLTGLEYVVFRREPLVLAVAPDHPLTRHGSITVAQLASVPLIATARGTSLRMWLDQAFLEAGARPDIILDTNELAAAVAYASIGIGGAVLTRSIIEGTGRPVAVVEITGAAAFEVALAWSLVSYRRPAAARALAFVQAIVEGGLPRTEGPTVSA